MFKLKECSPQFSFLLFLIFLSWEGPLIMYFGAREGDFIFILAGFFLTIFLWLFLGLNSFCEMLSRRDKAKIIHTDIK